MGLTHSLIGTPLQLYDRASDLAQRLFTAGQLDSFEMVRVAVRWLPLCVGGWGAPAVGAMGTV